MEALSFLSGAGYASSAKYFDIRYSMRFFVKKPNLTKVQTRGPICRLPRQRARSCQRPFARHSGALSLGAAEY